MIAEFTDEVIKAKGCQVEDAGHIYIECRSCKEKLVDIWIVYPKETQVNTAYAECCFCGDRSFDVKFSGGFACAGYGESDPNDENNVFPHTNVIDVNTRILYMTKK